MAGKVFINGTGSTASNHPAGDTYDASLTFGSDGYSQSKYPKAGCNSVAKAAVTAGVVRV